MTQVYPCKNGVTEPSLSEISPSEVGHGEVNPSEVGHGEVGPSEVGPEEVGPGEVGPSEVGLGEVRTNVPMLTSPRIPGTEVLLDEINVFLVSHLNLLVWGAASIVSLPLHTGKDCSG